MTLPVSLNPFPNPVPGMDLPATILNVRGQDNAIADTLNAVILALGGGGLPIVINAANVTAGTFGANVGGGNYVFPADVTLSTLHVAGASSGAVSFVAPAAAGSATYVLPDADGSNNYVLTTDGSGNLSWSNKTGGTPGSISSINGDSSAAQTLAAGGGVTIVDAGPVHTYALDLNYAPVYTTTVTAATLTAATNVTVGIAGVGGGSANTVLWNYELNTASRSWQMANDLSAFGDFAIRQSTTRTGGVYANALYFDASLSATLGANLALPGDLNVNSGKFTVDHATGNTAIAGTLAVGGTNFTVAASGNSTIGGTLQVSGLITASQGVSIAGSETLTFGTSSVVAGAPTWSSDQAITLATAAQPNITSVGTLVGLTVSGGSLISRNDFIVGIGTTFKVSAITGNTAIVGNVGIGSLGPTSTSPLNITGLPTSAVGLNPGDLYSLAGTVHVA